MASPEPSVSLRPWAADDLDLLHRPLGDPAMTEFLGGPETPHQSAKRHERYLELGDGEMLVVVRESDGRSVGSIGSGTSSGRASTSGRRAGRSCPRRRDVASPPPQFGPASTGSGRA